ncbi:hypothetical protein LPJ71_010369, partial [Coemansia sp. S17]
MRQQQVREMAEARWRQEEERRELLKLQRRPTMMERRRVMQELALSRNKSPAQSPNSVLQLVFDYLLPVPGLACTPTELTAHLLSLQRVAAVSREWRAVALPLFYRTAHVVIGHPLDPRDIDDSDSDDDEDDSMNIDDEDDDEDDSMNINDEDLIDTEGQGKASMSIGKGQGKVDTVGRTADEALLTTVGLSRSGVDIRLHTNIGLFTAAGLVDKASEVQIVVQGMGQTAGQLLRQLLLAELGRHTWPAVERLRIDMRGSSSTPQTNTIAER